MKKLIILLAVLAVLVIVGCSLVRTLFYPPTVESKEIHAKQGKALSFDQWNSGLQIYVKDGYVSYTKWKKDSDSVEKTLQMLAGISEKEIARDHLLAAYINAYNAFTVKLIFEYLPDIKSINDIPKAKRWEDSRWEIGGRKVSLNYLEHEIIRKEFIEPRIHFAIVCASIGCPHLLSEAYEGYSLEEQLNRSAKNFFQREENLKISGNTIYLSSILDWFRGDFVRDELATELGWFGDDYLQANTKTRLLMFVAKFAPAQIQKEIEKDYNKWSISYSTYDWNLNGE